MEQFVGFDDHVRQALADEPDDIQGQSFSFAVYTAEELALHEISTGAQNDLQRATDIARAMVTEFGMSDALGAINYDGQKRARFLDIPLPAERGLYGEETARKIDAEIARILTEAHNTARRVLTATHAVFAACPPPYAPRMP